MDQGTAQINELLKTALAKQRAGHLEQAEGLYRHVLEYRPMDPHALHSLGLIAIHRSDYAQAVDLLQKAVEANPNCAIHHNSLGVALEHLGRIDQAINHFRQAILIRQDYSEAYNNLAIALNKKGQYEQAIEICKRAIEIDPRCAKAHYTMGHCLACLGRQDEAMASFGNALALDDRLVEAYNQLAVILCQKGLYQRAIGYLRKAIEIDPDLPDLYNNMGIALRAMGRLSQAIDYYKKALELEPAFPEALYNLANAQYKLGMLSSALDCCKKALQLRPDYAQAYNQLGMILAALSDYEGAIAAYQNAICLDGSCAEFYNNIAIVQKQIHRYDLAAQNYLKAIELEPGFAQAWFNLAGMLQQMGRPDKAIECYDKAIELQGGDYPDARWNKAITLLLKGDLKEGWQQYRWRYKANLDQALYPYTWQKPIWQGQILEGKSIVIYCEQGLGDAIQFVRYVPMVRSFGPRTLILEAWPALVRLFSTIKGVDMVVQAHAAELEQQVDLVASVMDLPAIFQTDLDSIPADVPYLLPDQQAIAQWKRRLPADTFNVGIVWAGRPTHGNDSNRSCQLEYFSVLADIKGVGIYALQKGPACSQIKSFDRPIQNLADQFEDMFDTANCIAALDLVISVDTAVAHLAGAIGRPVWTILPFAPDWRWMLNRTDSPWYPTMRLFRQPSPGDWHSVFAQLRQQLQITVQERCKS